MTFQLSALLHTKNRDRDHPLR